MNMLEQLKKLTIIVSDTGEIGEIKKYQPTDATTNPSLIVSAADKAEYKFLVDNAIDYGKKNAQNAQERLQLIMDKIFVNFGIEILKIIPGRISTEVDARLSYDIEGSVNKARSLIKLYEEEGINRNRVLIKLASTWEGIKAAEILEKEGIHCNMTLLFSLCQAIASAEAKATLISPFVGRILDWYKKNEGKDAYAPSEDPGVKSVTEIYNYYKKMGYETVIMGASFRNKEEILELAGCDLLTIAPKLLEELKNAEGKVQEKLNAESAKKLSIEKISMNEKTFRWMLSEDAMATDKLAEGIRNFAKDIKKLESRILSLIS